MSSRSKTFPRRSRKRAKFSCACAPAGVSVPRRRRAQRHLPARRHLPADHRARNCGRCSGTRHRDASAHGRRPRLQQGVFQLWRVPLLPQWSRRRAARGGLSAAAMPSSHCPAGRRLHGVFPTRYPTKPQAGSALAGAALNAVRDVAKVQIGETVLITGATGGVGRPATEIARHAGGLRAGDWCDAQRAQAGLPPPIGCPRGHRIARWRQLLVRGKAAYRRRRRRRDRRQCRQPPLRCRLRQLGRRTDDTLLSVSCSGRTSRSIRRASSWSAQLLGVGSVSRSQLEDVVGLAAVNVVRPASRRGDAARRNRQGACAGRGGPRRRPGRRRPVALIGGTRGQIRRKQC